MQILAERCKEAQEAIVGSMLIDDTCIGAVMAAVSEEDFLHAPCRTVYRVIRELFTAGSPVDPVIVTNALSKDGAYSQYLMQLMEVTPTAAHVEHYCQILRENSRLLRLQALGDALQQAPELDAAKKITQKINRLLVEQSGSTIYTAADIARSFCDRMGEEKKPEYISTGFPQIDEKTYIELGDVVGIGAAPSTGKTAFALQWATRIAKKYRVGFYSLETGLNKISDRIFAREAEISLGDIKKRILPEEAWNRIAPTASAISELHLDFIQASGMTAGDIMAMAVSRRHQIIFVDYLQLVTGSKKDNSRYDLVTQASMEFHTSAQRNSIAVVLLSQLARPEKKKDGKYVPPDMHSFRESGQIEQDLDVALLLYLKDPDNYRSDRVVKIGKNKEGEKGSVELAFDGRTQTFGRSAAGAYQQIRKMTAEAKRNATKESEPFSQLEYPIVDDAVPF